MRLGREIEINIVELRKADRLIEKSTELRDWITFFQHWNEEKAMANATSASVRNTYHRLEALSTDPEAKRLAAVRERALHDEATYLHEAEQRGEQRGKEEGRQEGRQEEREENIRKLVATGMTEQQARAILG